VVSPSTHRNREADVLPGVPLSDRRDAETSDDLQKLEGIDGTPRHDDLAAAVTAAAAIAARRESLT
jgi:hypothetical protein